MFAQRKWMISLALLSLGASAHAGTLVYAVSLFGPFGTIDVSTGAFNQIGPALSDPLGGLVLGPNGYLGVSVSGNLDSLNPATGGVTVIGATGLGSQADTMAILNGTVYETDLSNNIYTVNTTTAVAQLIGNTGIPPCPPPPLAGDESLFTANGNLYETFDTLDPSTFTPIIDPDLYQINPVTGLATSGDRGVRLHGKGLGQQAQGTDRGLQLVADVGHEVPPDLLEPTALGHALADRHQPR